MILEGVIVLEWPVRTHYRGKGPMADNKFCRVILKILTPDKIML